MIFAFFLHVTCPDVYRMLPTASSFLTRALQLASSRPPVLYAILTQGLAHRRMDYLVDTSMARWSADEDQVDVYAQYARAIACLARYLRETRDEREKVEVMLLSCMVFVCFEVGQGRGAEAERHLRAGRRVVAEQFGAGTRLPIPAWAAEMQDGLREDAAGEARAQRLVVPGPSCRMPVAFADAAEARAHLDVLVESAETLRRDFLAAAKGAVGRLPDAPFEHGIASILTICTARTRGRHAPRSLDQRLDVLVRSHQQWHQAFDNLVAGATIPPTQVPHLLLLLRIQHFTSHFTLTTLANPTEDFIATWTDRFATIIETCQTYLSLPSTAPASALCGPDSLPAPTPIGPSNPISRPSVSLLPRLFPALHTIALRARCPLLRRRAIDVLLSCRRQESLFFSQFVAVFDNAILELEEAEMSRGRAGFSELMVDALPTEDRRKEAGSVVFWAGRTLRKDGLEGQGGWVVEVGKWEARGLPLHPRLVWTRQFGVG